MRLPILTLLYFLFSLTFGVSQKTIDGVVTYGDEWIDHDKSYLKLKVAEDGIYKVSYDQLSSAGFPMESTPMSEFQMMHLGKEVALKTTSNGIAQNDDYLMFYGEKNRGEVDRFAFENDADILNPDYSLISDTSAYFLTINSGTNLRYEEVITQEADISLPNPSYYFKDEKVVFHERLFDPNFGRDKVTYSKLVTAEGYAKIQKKKIDVNLGVNNLYADGPDIEVYLRGATNKNNRHYTQLRINNELVLDDTLGAYEILDIAHTIDNADVGNNLKFSLEGVAESSDLNTIAYIHMLYPAAWSSISNQESILLPSGNYALPIDADYLLDVTNNRLIYSYSGNYKYDSSIDAKVIIAENNEKEVILDGYQSYPNILENPEFNFLILTNKEAFDDTDIINEYADYRRSAEGGSFDVKVVDVNELYDMYAYGVDRHFVSIRNFAYRLSEVATNLEYAFIIGKAVQYNNNRSDAQVKDRSNLVPTFGVPGSDNLLFTRFGEVIPYVPVGRIVANSAEQVSWYLNKLKDYNAQKDAPQTIEDQYWKKNIMHLSGGSTNEYLAIESILNSMRDIIVVNKVGAQVNSFYKYSDNGENGSFLDRTLERINDGQVIVSQFGHGAVNSVDFSIADPDKFSNYKKYHLLMSYGCLTGNCHTPGIGLSERYVINKDKASIGFLATSGYGYISTLSSFGRKYYSLYGNEYYGESVGKTVKAVLEEMKNESSSIGNKTFLEQWTFHGDPAVTLYHFLGPDYIFDYESAKTNPSLINAYSESAEMCVDIYNIGKNLDDSQLPIQLIHYKEDGSIALDSTFVIDSPANKENICFTLHFGNLSYIGKNRVELILNPEETIKELPNPSALSNNMLVSPQGKVGYEFTVISNSAIATVPYTYSIVNDRKIDLIATTYNAFADSSHYIMELDTLPNFDSPYKKTIKITSRSPIKWNVELLDIDEQVYYWRVAVDTSTIENSIPIWDESSFTYIPGDVQGWNQGHWGQLDDNEFERLQFTDESNIKFNEFGRSIVVYNQLNSRPKIDVDGITIDVWQKNINVGVIVTILDPVKGAWLSLPNDTPFGNINTKGGTHYYEFPIDDEDSVNNLIDMIENHVGDGLTVIFQLVQSRNNPYNMNYLQSQYQNNIGLLKYWESLGASLIPDLIEDENRPYVFVYKKGSGLVTEELGDTNETLEVTFSWDQLFNDGNVHTKLIGPSVNFLRLQAPSTSNAEDSIFYSIQLIDKNGDEHEYVSLSKEVEIDLTDINTSIYPFIKLTTTIKDIKSKTPLMPEFIRVIYEPSQDITISSEAISLNDYNQGDPIKLNFNIYNLYGKPVSSTFDIKYTYQQNSKEEEKILFIDGLKRREVKNVEIEIDTKNLKGSYVMQCVVNSQKNIIENNYLNNTGVLDFFITPDNINPRIDVSFDGRTIMNNDIVSAKPEISIKLYDNNIRNFTVDTSNYQFVLRNSAGVIIDISKLYDIAIDNTDPKFSELSFQPLLQTGEYNLAVHAVDANLNKTDTYEVNFRVIAEQSISEVYNYPNPFSTSTQFVFTLTGTEIPTNIMLRIYTISGKVVREIDVEELGSLRIGNNITDFKWDGTDEYGKKLANGVYLYKFESLDQDGIELKTIDLNSKESKFFNNGFGKMVILR